MWGLRDEIREKLEMPLEEDQSEKLPLASCVPLSKVFWLPESVPSWENGDGTIAPTSRCGYKE